MLPYSSNQLVLFFVKGPAKFSYLMPSSFRGPSKLFALAHVFSCKRTTFDVWVEFSLEAQGPMDAVITGKGMYVHVNMAYF